jgi:16S rRNA (guanine527-N7)-methyltransferase
MPHSLLNLAREMGIELTPAHLAAFDTYYAELIAWNARVNLTTITDRAEVDLKHFADSLSASLALDRKNVALVDLGAGAGFPGLPLAIVFPDLRVTLVEATGKKVAFLEHLIAQLALSNARAIHSRAEDLGRAPEHRARYDIAIARAVADLAVLVEYALPLLCVGGKFIALKGVDVADEIEHARGALDLLGGKIYATIPVQLSGLEVRHLVVVAKTRETPNVYPRRAGMAEKKPLGR